MPMAVNPLLKIHHLSKRFPGVLALNGIDLEINQGETHVLLGENGAGKSTLVKILSGVHQPDGGEIFFGGQPYHPTTPHAALQAGVRLIHQELNLISYLTVAENLFIDNLPRRWGLVQRQELQARAEESLANVGLEVSPQTPVEDLNVAQMQMVEIAKALSSKSRLLIMDEPTASLSSKETSRLFEIIHQLKSQGVTLIYISHRLEEIHEVGDRFTVLRNGQKVFTGLLEGTGVEEIVRMMVGRELSGRSSAHGDSEPGGEVLRVEELRPQGAAHGVSFSVRAGEILGIAGLVGAGRSEVLRAIFGADPKASGRVLLNGYPISIRSPRDAVNHGISLLTENRKEEGLVLDMPCYVNISLANLGAISRAGLLQLKAEREVAHQSVRQLSIRTPSIAREVRTLSGGNQQKIVLGKWLFRDTQVLMIDEPTKGIDVGTRYEFYRLLEDLAAKGKAILVVSSDLPELLGLCHRMLVFSKGRITGALERSQFDQERILSLAYQEHLRERVAA